MTIVQALPSQVTSTITPSFARQLTGFVRVLRNNDFVVGVREILNATEVARDSDWSRPVILRDAWRTLLCTRLADWKCFDELFDAYWLHRGIQNKARVSGMSNRSSDRRTINDLGGNGGKWKVDHVEAGGDDSHAVKSENRSDGASRSETLETMDMRYVHDPEQLEQAYLVAEQLAKQLRHRLARRDRASQRGRRLDLRRVIRRSIGFGGTPIRLAFRHRPPKPLRLVMLMDASGSMNQYGAFFLRFMRGVLDSFREAEAFVFHTRLIQISEVMREHNTHKAMEKLSLMTTGWSGGTRIGECLKSFNYHHAKRVLNGRTVVMILSDGYDTSPPEVLAAELARLKQRAKRLVWLNPMMGWKDYQPVAKGMQAALPHIDLLAPAHNLKSLSALAPYLAKL